MLPHCQRLQREQRVNDWTEACRSVWYSPAACPVDNQSGLLVALALVAADCSQRDPIGTG